MRKLFYQLISVFTGDAAKGNIAAVCHFDGYLSGDEMQKMAEDLNQPATAFIQQSGSAYQYNIRWFAPDAEIENCGHGAFASAAFLKEKGLETATFEPISTEKMMWHLNDIGKISLQLAIIPSKLHPHIRPELESGLGCKVLEYHINNNKHIVRVASEEIIRQLKPNFHALAQLPPFGYIVTAKGETTDFVSRTFVPKVRQLEDHGTGSSHAALAPYWSRELNKSTLSARQLSPRGALMSCTITENQVNITADYKIIGEGEYFL
ncbi:MAG: PhzF family phenazine biosynthesis protein [Cyclobacteriaceae bacterium]|nr:PhzF family phenazine biosynthesis protein [Cyclobacteriaceae bacterium]MCH8516106.1 PhzF family phenazine biosynthesis protein [Cyclobacteriaceae bacterium]